MFIDSVEFNFLSLVGKGLLFIAAIHIFAYTVTFLIYKTSMKTKYNNTYNSIYYTFFD